MIDDGSKDLAGSGLDVTGAMAILNIGSFNTFTARVEKHKAGSPSFTYNDTFGKLHFKPKQNVYFLEDKLEFLDQAGEWFYDKTDKMLYVWTNDGASPQVIYSDGSCAGHSYKQIHSVSFICNPWSILVIIIARDTYTYKDIDSTP